MNYNHLALTMSLAGLAGPVMASQEQAEAKDKHSRPNIIIILADDLGYSDLGCYGGEVHTPNLDALASDGLRFTRFYNCSRSCPTRASLLTGLYQHQAGIGRMTFDAGLPGYRGTLSRDAVTIAEVLRQNGYATDMVGKWHIAETPLRKDQRDWLNHHVYHERYSDLANYPINRGFDRYYGTIYGVVDYFDPFSLVEGEEPVKEVPEGYYVTQALSDRAVSDINEYAKGDKPFFMYLAYNSPHWPLMALPEDIDKYKDTYKAGWEAIRNARYERQKKMHLFGNQQDFLSERQFHDSWAENKDSVWDARAMAVHAAMIDRMDQGIGQVVEALRKNGMLDNTLIFFLSDNGCSNEVCQNMLPGENDRPDRTRDGRVIVYPKNKEVLPGPETTYASLGARWANVSNTPFRFWKAREYEGGICTPLIAHWPATIKQKGAITTQAGHVIDLMATCLDVAGAEYPTTYKGHSIIPMEGESLLPVLEGKQRQGHDYLGFEHFNERALISRNGWKIVRKDKEQAWELYNLNEDRSEKHDLAARYPARVAQMDKAYHEWADRCMVEPKPGEKSGNPFVSGWYADPDAVYYGDSCWVYPTSSNGRLKATYFDAFSSADLVHWTKHPCILDTASVSWAYKAMWAPCSIKRHGKYYLFFSANDIEEGETGGIGVTIADRPEGPYRDALGHPLVGHIVNGAEPIDQCVFQDDDGQFYMYYGGRGHCNVVKLSDDLLSLVPFSDGSVYKEITPEQYVEGPYMLRRDGKYYLMWSEGGWEGAGYRVGYGIGDNPLGPFHRQGVILEQDPAIGTGTGHHSVITVPGTDKTYVGYHRHPAGDSVATHRVLCLDRLDFDDKGLIRKVKITNEGVPATTVIKE